MTRDDHSAPGEVSPEFVALQQAVLGRYSLHGELGRGGMGIVFLARDVALDRPVAIKLLPPAFAASPVPRERFLREARAAARLSHPHIVPVHAVEAHGPVVFFVMSYVEGETLGARVRRAGPLPPGEAMRVVQEVAWALAHAHANGVVHRDVKPDNILLERDGGRALVTDFGIAQLAPGATGPLDSHTPAAGQAVGTPQYMSPEQATGERVDARSDLYALGATAFLAATGRLPFEGRTALALMAQHAATPAPALHPLRPALPVRFAAAVDRCLAKDPDDRFASAEELAIVIGEARGARPEAPAPVRAFLRDAGAAGGEIGTALTAAVASLGVMGISLVVDPSLFVFLTVAIYSLTAVIAVALAGMRAAQVVGAARALLWRGHGHEAVRAALAAEARERALEPEAFAADARPASGIARRLATAALGVAASVGGVLLGEADDGFLIGLLGITLSVVAPTLALRALWRGWPGGRGLWERMLAGGLGRATFRLAGLGLRSADRAPVATAGRPGEPTVVALGRAAEELFAALPAAQRGRFADVPALVGRLQADAARLRPGAEDPGVAERLRVTAAALEAIRLDLLRLHAGSGSLDELTRDVEAARDLGRRVDAALEVRARANARERTPPGHTPPGWAPTPD
jgi:serine/threonine-protein kinase